MGHTVLNWYGFARRKLAIVVAILFIPLVGVVVMSGSASAITAVQLYVSTSGSGTVCSQPSPCSSIGTAIATATGGSYTGDDVTINVAVGTYNESDSISASSLNSLAIVGAGAPTTTIDGTSPGTVLTINNGTVTVSDLTITGGTLKSGVLGGGVTNAGTATLSDDAISGNTSYGGGGVYNTGMATLTHDTLSGDLAYIAGGGLWNYSGATATLTDDTLSGDSSGAAGALITEGLGGGVYNNGTATLTDDTLSGDSTYTAGNGGGLNNASGSTVTVGNSIVDNADCFGTVVDAGYNVESDNTCGFGTHSVENSSTINLATTLAANGSTGPETLAIGTTSSAYSEVPLSACVVVTTDERGIPRPGVAGQNCDAGAFEYQVPGFHIATTSLPNAMLSVPYGPVTLQASGQTAGATLKWKKLSLPRGLKLASGGLLSGIPNKRLTPNQNYTVSVEVTQKYKVSRVRTSQTVTASLNLFIS